MADTALGLHQFVLNSGTEVRLRPADFGVEPIGSMNQITSEVNYRTARGMASSDLAVVFKRVKDEIAEVICTDIPYGPMPEVSCVNHAPSCGREGATARHLLTRPIPELGVSIGDILCVDSLSGDVTVERKQ